MTRKINKRRMIREFGEGIKSTVLGMIGGIMLFFLITNMMPYLQNDIRYQSYTEKAKIDTILPIIAELCLTHDTKTAQMECVVDFYGNHYDYVLHNESFRPASIFLEKGGICRDIAINICATLDIMNISCRYIFVEGHVFNIIDFTEFERYSYCTYDGMLNCRHN